MKLGIRASESGGRLKVTHVLEGTPAWRGGVNAGDELIAVSGVRATASSLESAARSLKTGDPLEIQLLRRDRAMSIRLSGEDPEPREWRILEAPSLSEAQRALLHGWLDPIAP